MHTLASFTVSILIDDQHEDVIKGMAGKMEGGMSEVEVWEECARLYQEGIVEVLEDEINVKDLVKVTVERIND